MGLQHRWVVLVAGLAFSAPGIAGAQETRPPALLTYWTAVELEDNTCDNVIVEPGPTEIARRPGSDSLSITHAGQTYLGVISQEGRFRTETKELVFGTTAYSIAITGQLAGEGFTAKVAVGVWEQGAPRGCSYTVKWTGRTG